MPFPGPCGLLRQKDFRGEVVVSPRAVVRFRLIHQGLRVGLGHGPYRFKYGIFAQWAKLSPSLGADAVGIGRPYLWGLGSFGQEGVETVLDILRRELEIIMKQAGTLSIKEITRDTVIT